MAKNNLKADFPALHHKVNGHPITFLDSAASAQKPQAVIDTMSKVMEQHYANIHRGLYQYSQTTTDLYEQSRRTVADFINADEDEVIFTRNATESLNLIAASRGSQVLEAGDNVVITALEHHANIVPWQVACEKAGATLKVAPINDQCEVDLDAFEQLIDQKTKVVAFNHISNAVGTINPIKQMVDLIRNKSDSDIVIDGCQSIVHMDIDVKALDVDFFVFSGHKLYGPSGIGVLWGRKETLDKMPPYQTGGDMIEVVTFDKTTYKLSPARFEAGTPAIIETIGLKSAIEYLTQNNFSECLGREEALYQKADSALRSIDGVTLYSNATSRAGILSFNLNGAHASDVSTLLDQQGVAVRAGHHCAMPLLDILGVSGTVRASFGIYNDQDDVDRFIAAIEKTQTLLNG